MPRGKGKGAGAPKGVNNRPELVQFEMMDRRKKAAHLYLQGKTQYEIAGLLDVTHATVSTDLKFIREQWLKDIVTDYNELKMRELARIDMIEEQCWDEWHRSKLDSTKTLKRVELVPRFQKKQVSTGEEEGDESKPAAKPGKSLGMVTTRTTNETVKVERLGDTRYLDQIRWCVEMRCKIVGLLKEEKAPPVNQFFMNWDQLYGRQQVQDPVEQRKALESAAHVIAAIDQQPGSTGESGPVSEQSVQPDTPPATGEVGSEETE